MRLYYALNVQNNRASASSDLHLFPLASPEEHHTGYADQRFGSDHCNENAGGPHFQLIAQEPCERDLECPEPYQVNIGRRFGITCSIKRIREHHPHSVENITE